MIAEEEPRAQKASNKQQNLSILFLQISCCNIPTNLTQGCDLIIWFQSLFLMSLAMVLIGDFAEK